MMEKEHTTCRGRRAWNQAVRRCNTLQGPTWAPTAANASESADRRALCALAAERAVGRRPPPEAQPREARPRGS